MLGGVYTNEYGTKAINGTGDVAAAGSITVLTVVVWPTRSSGEPKSEER